MKLGIQVLLDDTPSIEYLRSKKVGLVAHPASVDPQLNHSVELLKQRGVELSCLFGPQHGIRGEKQDNMIESEDFIDPKYGIPAFSLYGEVRRPTKEMLDHFDVLLFDLQDVGCRIYTFLTTLFYLIEDLADSEKELWVLDRPNPAGRPVEGSLLTKEYFSFVGGGEVPMRHGLTLAEAAQWFRAHYNLNTSLKIVAMENYKLGAADQWGWPEHMPWVNPSPNLPTLSGCRAYPGTVLIEGTHLSEGRGTTRPLEVIGAPMIDPDQLVSDLKANFGQWTKGCLLRPCFFEPTFHKFQGELCGGIHIHTDNCCYNEESFYPYRLTVLILKWIHQKYPDFEIFKNPPYEYEDTLLPIEILSGGTLLKSWVEGDDDPSDLFRSLSEDEARWREQRQPHLLYEKSR